MSIHIIWKLSYLDIELDVVTIKFIVVVVQQVVTLQLELLHDLMELLNQLLHAFQLILGQGVELINRTEHINKLDHSSAKQVELAKDLHFVERKLLALGSLLQLGLGESVLLLVSLVQLQARLQLAN